MAGCSMACGRGNGGFTVWAGPPGSRGVGRGVEVPGSGA